MIEAFHLDRNIPALLLAWYRKNARDLPWRDNRDPYRVWLSEIMLQQTRVDTVIPYYLRFLEQLPTLSALAEADESSLYKLWEGLGYYSRARNLHRAAKIIVSDFDGEFPQDPVQLRALPGIGDYTTGAIASICFELAVPAVDGNVLRVVSRIARLDAEAKDPALKKAATSALTEVFPSTGRGDFTQSLMELGATVCLPNGPPLCSVCPLSGLCGAHRHGEAEKYPRKSAKASRKTEQLTVFVLRNSGDTALQQRPNKGLLAGLWQLPNVAGHLDAEAARAQLSRWFVGEFELGACYERKHIFTHIEWQMRCYEVLCRRQISDFVWTQPGSADSAYALPTAFKKCLKG